MELYVSLFGLDLDLRVGRFRGTPNNTPAPIATMPLSDLLGAMQQKGRAAEAQDRRPGAGGYI